MYICNVHPASSLRRLHARVTVPSRSLISQPGDSHLRIAAQTQLKNSSVAPDATEWAQFVVPLLLDIWQLNATHVSRWKSLSDGSWSWRSPGIGQATGSMVLLQSGGKIGKPVSCGQRPMQHDPGVASDNQRPVLVLKAFNLFHCCHVLCWVCIELLWLPFSVQMDPNGIKWWKVHGHRTWT